LLAGDQHEERLESHLRFRVTFQLPRRNNELARRLVVTPKLFLRCECPLWVISGHFGLFE
jgi:hypothetical protein